MFDITQYDNIGSDPDNAISLHRSKEHYKLEAGGNIIGLNLCETELADVSFLNERRFEYLQVLNLSGNSMTEVVLPDWMVHLRVVDFSDCSALTSLRLPRGATQLERLDVSDCKLDWLVLPESLAKLTYFDGSRNELKEVVLPQDCKKLKHLDLSSNKISSLLLEGEFPSLEYLYLCDNAMKELKLEADLPKIKILHLSNNKLQKLPQTAILSPSLQTLYAGNNIPKNIPYLFLGTDNSRDCLQDAQIWFTEIRDFKTDINYQVKLMLTGNGDTGKSTLLCALENGKCNCKEKHSTTHGIQIKSLALDKAIFNVWDFGGQEIYHGTHRLFMESPAVQVLVFNPDIEERAKAGISAKDRVGDEMVFDHRIEYWYETASKLSPNSPFIFVQSKADIIPEENDVISKYARDNGGKFQQISATKGDEIDVLELKLKKAAKQLPEYEMLMPYSWLEVRKFFIDNLAVESENRRKTMKWADFVQLCKKVNEKTLPLLSRYLHHSGYIYQHEKLGDTIIIDQEWALEAIYKLLNRESKQYQRRKADNRAEIAVYEIFEIFGNKYEDEQKKLFLIFMENCGICFKLNKMESTDAFSEIDSYIFPEFFPDKLNQVVEKDWKERTIDLMQFRYKLLYPNYPKFLAYITSLGRKTNVKNIWRNGIMVGTEEGWFRVELDYATPAILLSIEQKATETWLKPILETLERGFDIEKGWELLSVSQNKWNPFSLEKWGKETKLSERQLHGAEKQIPQELPSVQSDSSIQRVLVLAANPLSTKKLSVDKEFSWLSEQVEDCENSKCSITFKPKSNVTLNNMIDYIKKIKPHFVHFVGHGEISEEKDLNAKSVLIFHSDDFREEEKVGSLDLKNTFESFKDYKDIPLHTIYLNACLSEDQAKAISEAGYIVIGANTEIRSTPARSVATNFYKEYSNTMDVKASLKVGLEYGRDHKTCFVMYEHGKKCNIN